MTTDKQILITGAAGFGGSRLAARISHFLFTVFVRVVRFSLRVCRPAGMS